MTDNKHDNDTQRWRDKYFSLCEEADKKQQDHVSYLHVLHRALVRISLAADGQDKELDKHLGNLRNLLRKEPVSQTNINSNLSQVESALLRLDNQRKDAGPQGFASLQALANQLLQLNLGKTQQRALKHFSKSLASKDDQLGSYPALLAEFRRLQKEALDDALINREDSQPAGKQAQESGFFSRMFGTKNNDTVLPAADNPSQTEILSEASTTLQTNNYHTTDGSADRQQQSPVDTVHQAPELNTATAIEEANNPVTPNNSDDNDKQETIIRILADLLEQLPLAPDIRDQAEQLRNHLVQLAAAGELDHIINSTADLVIKALEKSQQDFEQFLLTLDQQLTQITHFLEAQGQNKTARSGATDQLNLMVRSQVGSISEAVGEAQDIRDLKVSVQSQLKTILASMDDFVETEHQREQALEKQLQEMQEQLTLAQVESQSIRKKLQNETLRALTDTLTRLPNREAFDERFNLERERFLRYKHPTSLAIIDIDHFKQVNDSHGHLVGDRVLQALGMQVKKMIRSTDFFARFGGEEFILIMPETDTSAACALLDKIRDSIAKIAVRNLGTQHPITVSCGLASFKLGEKAEQLIERADNALYRAKDAGRNRVETAEN